MFLMPVTVQTVPVSEDSPVIVADVVSTSAALNNILYW